MGFPCVALQLYQPNFASKKKSHDAAKCFISWKPSVLCMKHAISSRIAGPGELFSFDFRACARSPRWKTRCFFGFFLSQLQLRCSNSITGPQASSSRSELSAKWAAKSVIAFCQADRNLSSKRLDTFKARNANLKFLDDRRKRKRKKTARSTCGRRSRPPPSIVRRSSQPRSLQVSFQICRVCFL